MVWLVSSMPEYFHRLLAPLLVAWVLAPWAGGCRERSLGEGAPDGAFDGGLQDAGEAGDAAPDAAPDAAFEPYCAIGGGDATGVQGTTPLGSVSAHRAFFGVMGGECGGRRVFLTPDRESLELLIEGLRTGEIDPGLDFLSLHPQTWDPVTRSYVGEGTAYVAHTRSGEMRSVQGWIRVTLDEPPSPSDYHPANEPLFGGQFEVTEDPEDPETTGWQLSGSFTAAYCAHLNLYCP